MKFSKSTVEVLTNYSTINNSIILRKGKKQRTSDMSTKILSIVTLDDEIPEEFAIFDLSQFLQLYSVMNDPDIEFNEKYLTMKTDKQHVSYRGCNPELIKIFNKDVPDFEYFVSFELNNDDLIKFNKTSSILKAEFISFEGDGESVYIKTHNDSDATSSSASLKIGNTEKTFKIVLKSDLIAGKVMNGNYDVHITDKKIIIVKNKDRDIQYIISPEMKNSKLD